jgi:hypothetical protein
MKKFIPTLILLLALTVMHCATAGEIYMWTDEDGNTQYVDRPAEGAVRLTTIESHGTDNDRVSANTQTRLDRQEVAEEEKVARRAQEASEQELRAKAEKRAGQCNTYRGRLEKLITSRRLYRDLGNGEREWLAEDEMTAARAKVQSQVEEYCSS